MLKTFVFCFLRNLQNRFFSCSAPERKGTYYVMKTLFDVSHISWSYHSWHKILCGILSSVSHASIISFGHSRPCETVSLKQETLEHGTVIRNVVVQSNICVHLSAHSNYFLWSRSGKDNNGVFCSTELPHYIKVCHERRCWLRATPNYVFLQRERSGSLNPPSVTWSDWVLLERWEYYPSAEVTIPSFT